MTEYNVGVLGGGLSGLTFASRNPNSFVLEKESVAGGLCRSVKENGYTFDLGSHIIFSRDKKVLQFMKRLCQGNLVEHKRNTKILYKGRYVKYPFENGLGDLPKEEALECVLDFIQAKEESKQSRHPANFKEWMYKTFGNAIADKYLYPYNKKIWDYPPEKMACGWVQGRVPQPPVCDVIKAAMSMESEGYTHQSKFFYPRKGGFQALTDALVKKVQYKRMLTNYEVGSVSKEDGKFYIKNKKYPSESRVVGSEFKKIVSTIPLDQLVRVYKGVPSDVRKAARALKYNSIHLVMLGMKKKKINDIHWLYVPDKNILFNRISFPSGYSPYNAPEGHSTILAEICFDPRGKKAKMSQEEILEQTIDDLTLLHGLDFVDRTMIDFKTVVTQKYAYVIYDQDSRKNMLPVTEFFETEGVKLMGRFGSWRYLNADACVGEAMKVE